MRGERVRTEHREAPLPRVELQRGLATGLAVSIGQVSDKGRKGTNQDFHGALIPSGATLASRGIAVAIADGIGTSAVSHIAAETAVKSLLTDYYCTSDAWSVKTVAQRVISAANSWLHAETKRSHSAYDLDKGYICTLSALVLKARRARVPRRRQLPSPGSRPERSSGSPKSIAPCSPL